MTPRIRVSLAHGPPRPGATGTKPHTRRCWRCARCCRRRTRRRAAAAAHATWHTPRGTRACCLSPRPRALRPCPPLTSCLHSAAARRWAPLPPGLSVHIVREPTGTNAALACAQARDKKRKNARAEVARTAAEAFDRTLHTKGLRIQRKIPHLLRHGGKRLPPPSPRIAWRAANRSYLRVGLSRLVWDSKQVCAPAGSGTAAPCALHWGRRALRLHPSGFSHAEPSGGGAISDAMHE